MSRIGSFIRRRPVVATLVGAGVLLAGVGAVNAQYGGWGGGGWRGHHGMGGQGMRGARLERMCGMETARWAPVVRAWVKADLNLSAAQSAEFDKLADVAQPAADQVRGEICGNFGPNAPKVTAPERLEKAAATARRAAEAMERAVAPAKAFYATLDERQKARIEELMERRRGRMGGQGYGRMGHHGGPKMGQGGMNQGGMNPGGMNPGQGMPTPGTPAMPSRP